MIPVGMDGETGGWGDKRERKLCLSEQYCLLPKRQHQAISDLEAGGFPLDKNQGFGCGQGIA